MNCVFSELTAPTKILKILVSHKRWKQPSPMNSWHDNTCEYSVPFGHQVLCCHWYLGPFCCWHGNPCSLPNHCFEEYQETWLELSNLFFLLLGCLQPTMTLFHSSLFPKAPRSPGTLALKSLALGLKMSVGLESPGISFYRHQEYSHKYYSYWMVYSLVIPWGITPKNVCTHL